MVYSSIDRIRREAEFYGSFGLGATKEIQEEISVSVEKNHIR